VIAICSATLLADIASTDERDLRAAAEGAREAGFTEASAWSNHIPALEAAGLQVGVVEAAMSWANADSSTAATEAKRLAALVAGHGATRVVAVCLESSLDIEHARRNLGLLVDVVSREGAQVCVEFLPWSGIPDLSTAWSLVEPLGPSAGIVLDTWHWLRQPDGPDLELLGSIPGERMGYVQLSDAPQEPADNLMRESMSSRLLPGEGVVDFVSVLSTLDAIASAPFVATEVFDPRLVTEIGAAGAAQAMRVAAERVIERRTEPHSGRTVD
jgi:sugar phosphate isomerase/epimerase